MKKIIAERLSTERERLGLKKGEMASAGCIANSTYTNYEEGKRSPDGDFLANIAAVGADVQYILTGIRTTPVITELNPREIALLDNYRHIEDENDKRIIERNAFLVAKANTYEATEQKVVNHR